ncbi:MAG TPA: T9SS type A sorting domain-containing protein [Bacteroidia bacterium]|nr:T9SS type A sorting domain-containing protein [Bacteroidia bacterium]
MKAKFILIIVLLVPVVSFGGINISVVKNSTCGNPTGQINTNVSGVSPFSFQWSNGETTSNITNLIPGVYTVYVTDGNGALDSASATVALVPYVSGVDLIFSSGPFGTIVGFPCPNQCNGILFFNTDISDATLPINPSVVLGGSSAYLTFNSSLNSMVVAGVCANEWISVDFVDDAGCPGSTNPSQPFPAGNYIDSISVFPSCQNQAVGKIRLSSELGSVITNPIQCTGPSFSQTLSQQFPYTEFANLLPGVYTITVTQPGAVICDSTFTVIVPNMGNNCGMIEGDVIIDSISNCILDLNEDPVVGQIVEATPGNYYSTTDSLGHFKAFLPFGTYQLRTIGSLGLDPVCLQSGLILSASNDTISNIVLGDTITVYIDASVSVTMGAIRPGFDHNDYIYVSNNSWSDSLYPVVNVVYDSQLTLINCPLPYTVISSHEIQIQLPIIAAHESYSLMLTYSVPANPNLIGTSIGTSASLSAVANDEISANNSDSDIRVVTGSFDPNEILVSPRNDPYNYFFMDVDTALSYTIYFQNTGTDTAFNIVVVDSLDQHLIPSTFEMLGSSHPCHFELTGQHTLKFYFDNILLPDSNVNEPMSHGYVKYKIKPELYLPINPYLISNRADIYFDFNPAIQTNTVVSTMDVSVGLNELSDVQFKVQPNPVENKLQIVSSNDIKINSILVTDLTGRVVLSEMKNATAVHVSNLASGMYCARIQYFATNSSNMHTSVVTFAKK